MRGRRSWRGMVVAVLLAAVGCGDDGGGGPGVLADDPIFKRYPTATLPYRAREGVRPGGNIFYRDILSQVAEDIYPLTAVVAIDPKHIAVVFPPSDRVGLDIAIAGIDMPWHRFALIDTPVEDVGAIDAVATPDGVIHVVVRERMAPKGLTHLSVTQVGAIVREPIPRPPGTAGSHWFSDHCPDVTLGVTPAGELDLVYRHDIDDLFATKVVFASRRQGVWQLADVFDSRDGRQPPPGEFYDHGCRNVVDYDDTDQPIVITLSRFLKTTIAQPSGLGAANFNTSNSFVRGADAKWRPGGIAFRRPTDSDTYRARFDLERHPRGVLLGAVSFNANELYLAGFALLQEFGTNPGEPILSFRRPHEAESLIDLDSGGKLIVTPCGGAAIMGANKLTAELERHPIPFAMTDCRLVPDQGPVIQTDEGDVPGLKDPAWTHGARPYTAGVCLGPANELVICYGDHHMVFGTAPVPRLSTEAELLRFARTSVADGATDVPITLDQITVRFEPKAEAGLSLADMSSDRRIEPASNDWNAATGDMTIHLDRPLEPGHRYRLTSYAPSQEANLGAAYFWHYLDVPYPTITFTTAGTLLTNPDPRTVPMHIYCDGVRAGDGICDLPAGVNPAPNGGLIVLRFDRRFDPVTSLAGFRLVDSTNTPTSAAVFTVSVEEELVTVAWTAPLAAGEVYTIELPAMRDMWGQTLDVIDRKTRFVTAGGGPPQVLSTVPAMGAMSVAVDATIYVTFNKPMLATTLVEPNLQLAPYMVGSPLPLAITIDSPSTLHFTHPALAATTTYQLTLTAGLTDTSGQALAAAPQVVLFRTAP